MRHGVHALLQPPLHRLVAHNLDVDNPIRALALCEFDAALAAWEEHRALVVAAMLAVTPETPKETFTRIEHDARDFEIVSVLVGLHPELVYEDWGQKQIWAFKYELEETPESRTGSRWVTSAHRAHFYRCRDAMRSRDPEEREKARGRDQKYRRSKKGKAKKKAYLAEYRATPEAKAKDAARKRTARAAKKKLETEQQKET